MSWYPTQLSVLVFERADAIIAAVVEFISVEMLCWITCAYVPDDGLVENVLRLDTATIRREGYGCDRAGMAL